MATMKDEAIRIQEIDDEIDRLGDVIEELECTGADCSQVYAKIRQLKADIIFTQEGTK